MNIEYGKKSYIQGYLRQSQSTQMCPEENKELNEINSGNVDYYYYK